ncbi:hypothetical protein HPB52_024528 [Rhipicephalus sanguineus]|uniref:RNase H type-1 domain-containing protein n=1 Tax=Rhipicephalus sanguineus TaxID=34632 RepID=A0A9D4TE72_RHISA|nr:hypothetical protein HPB52_024528 [Rhipicephalus sanguineus]
MAGTVRPSDVRLLYRQVVLPAIAYASPIWWPERPDCRLRSRLLSVQRSVLLALTGAYKTTRTAALQLLLHAPPIELELWRLNREFTLFVLRQPVECDGHTYAADNVALPLDRWTRHPSCAPQERPVCRLSVQQARATARQYGLHVYTDGSHTSLSSGAAYVVFGRGTSTKAVGRYRVYGATSAYAAELVAFTEALVYLRSSASRMPAFVYTDCLSVLQAIASPYCLDPRVNHLRELMAQISASRPLRAFHVPGHRGLFGNELADYLAERACRVGLVRTVPQSVRDVRERFRHDMIETWARDWSVHHTSTELFKWTPDVRQLPAFYPPNRNLVTLLTGHGRFPCYFYRFGLMEEATCPCGGQCENLDHYYTVCPMTAPLVALMRHSADLATDDRRRVLADDRNRALLTQLVTTISEHTKHGLLLSCCTGPSAKNGGELFPSPCGASTCHRWFFFQRSGRASLFTGHRLRASPRTSQPARTPTVLAADPVIAGLQRQYIMDQGGPTFTWTPPQDIRTAAEQWTGGERTPTLMLETTPRRLQGGH